MRGLFLPREPGKQGTREQSTNSISEIPQYDVRRDSSRVAAGGGRGNIRYGIYDTVKFFTVILRISEKISLLAHVSVALCRSSGRSGQFSSHSISCIRE